MAKETTPVTPATNGNKPKDDDFVKVENTYADPWKPVAAGESIVGLYVGYQDVTTTDNKGKKSEFRAYHLRTDDGGKLSVTGAGLATIMAQIPRRTKCKITYLGMVRKGAGDMKDFDVQVPRGTPMLDPFDTEENQE